MNSPALLVVHGIGRQAPGDTLLQCVQGILSVCPNARVSDGAGNQIEAGEIQEKRLQHVCLRQVTGETEIRLYEVYWADLLPDDAVQDTFSKFAFEETTWFPLLNFRSGLLSKEEYSWPLIAFRTFELWILQVVMTIILEVVVSIRKIKTTILDETAADVWHYVHSLAGELAANSPLLGASERILDRFQATWAKAEAEAQSIEDVHIIAHSLGSVIAYHGMLRRLPEKALTRFITIGSPLEKVRFLWAKLFPRRLGWTGEWLNYHTISDPVSGKLKRFDLDKTRRINNMRLWGVGGFGEAHVGYFRNARVMARLAEGFGFSTTTPSRSMWRTLWQRRFDVIVPFGTALLMVTGVFLYCLFFFVIIWACGFALELLSRPFSSRVAAQIGDGYKVVFYWLTPFAWLIFLTKDGYNRSLTRHKRRWR